MTPKFSIIIPVYNVENYLHDCLDSVLNQIYQGNYEVICVNDGSTDTSLKILEEYKKNTSDLIIISQENKGLSEARNTGLRVAKGDYVFFLDSDDWIEPNTLQVLSKNINGEDFIGFNGRRYFEDGTQEVPDKDVVENNMSGWEYYNKYALVSRKFHFVCVVLRIYRREFLLDNNLFFEPGIYHEDNLFTPLVCYYAKKVKIIPEILYVYRIREGSISYSYSKKQLEDIIKIANKLADFFIPFQDIEKNIIYRAITGTYLLVFVTSPTNKSISDNYKLLKDKIDWSSFKIVAYNGGYVRHRKLYRILKISPILFHYYLKLETFLRNARYKK